MMPILSLVRLLRNIWWMENLELAAKHQNIYKTTQGEGQDGPGNKGGGFDGKRGTKRGGYAWMITPLETRKPPS